jgi:hypothetical protein
MEGERVREVAGARRGRVRVLEPHPGGLARELGVVVERGADPQPPRALDLGARDEKVEVEVGRIAIGGAPVHSTLARVSLRPAGARVALAVRVLPSLSVGKAARDVGEPKVDRSDRRR